MSRIAFVLLATLVVAACGRKEPPPDPTQAPSAASQPEAAPAPGGVPGEFTALVEENWPKIEKEAERFLAEFEKASKARASGDRDALNAANEAARDHWQTLQDLWAEIAYWPINEKEDGNIDAAVADACERHIRAYSRKVNDWTKKAKGLKELSTVK